MLSGKNKKNRYTPVEGASGFAVGYILVNVAAGILAFFWILVTIAKMSAEEIENIDFNNMLNIIDKRFIFVTMVFTQIAFIAAFFAISKFSKTDYMRASGIDKRVTLKEVMLVAAISVICVYFLSGAAGAFEILLQSIGYKSAGLGFEFEGAGDFVVGMLIIVIMAPIGEELIFRGMLQRGMENGMSAKKAVLLSALAFMVMHANPEQTVHQFLLGLVLGWIVVRTGKLLLAVLLHALNNFLALLFEYVPALTDWYNNMFEKMHTAVAVLVLLMFSAVASVVIYFLIGMMDKKEEQKEEQEQPQQEQQSVQEVPQGAEAQVPQQPPYAQQPQQPYPNQPYPYNYYAQPVMSAEALQRVTKARQKRNFRLIYWCMIAFCCGAWLITFVTQMTA